MTAAKTPAAKTPAANPLADTFAALRAAAAERILVLDGAMGTMIQ